MEKKLKYCKFGPFSPRKILCTGQNNIFQVKFSPIIKTLLVKWFFGGEFLSICKKSFKKGICCHKFPAFENNCHPPPKATIVYKWKGAYDFLLSYFEYRQIWLNIVREDHHLSNITKLEKNTDPVGNQVWLNSLMDDGHFRSGIFFFKFLK